MTSMVPNKNIYHKDVTHDQYVWYAIWFVVGCIVVVGVCVIVYSGVGGLWL
jgi:hypothetical protein